MFKKGKLYLQNVNIDKTVSRQWFISYRILRAGVQSTLDPYAEAFL